MSNIIKKALIMAAGKGERLHPFTEFVPKALIDIEGTPLIDYSLNRLSGIIENIYITVGYKKEILLNHISNKGITRVIDTSKKGNSWWIFHSELKYIDEPVLVLPCDIITYIDLGFIKNEYEKLKLPICMLVPIYPVSGVEGDYIHAEDKRVIDLSRENQTALFCSGIQVINPRKINEEMSTQIDFNQVWNKLIIKNKLYCSEYYPYSWYTINTEKQYNEVKNNIRKLNFIPQTTYR